MGYILPVTPYQSIQYAERELKVKDNPYRFVPTPKVMNEMKYERYVERYHQDQQRGKGREKHPQHYDTPLNNDEIDMAILEKIHAEVTGKGKSFSEYV